MKKVFLILICVVVIIGIVLAGWYYFNFKKYAPDTYVIDEQIDNNKNLPTTTSVTSETTTNSTNTETITVNTVNGTKTKGSPVFAMSDIATHKDATSCYTVINNYVYDLTMWVNMHPGGKGAILSICGVDGTDKFINKHKGGEKYMTILTRYKIGEVKQ